MDPISDKNVNKIPSSEKNLSFIKNALSRGTIHGFKYLLEEKTSVCEKIFWMLVFTSALVCAALHLQKVWSTYESNLTRTTIVSTYYKYTNIPFPSVTVCDSSRIDWSKINNTSLLEFWKNIGNLSTEDERKLKSDLKKLMAALSITQFGAPKDLNHVKDVYGSRKLDNLRISQFLRKGMRSCEQMFVQKCWWRTAYHPCCELFELQKTGYGYCYSFNSDISEKSKVDSLDYGINDVKNDRWIDWNRHIRPRRTAGHNVWTGLRFGIKPQKLPSYVKAKSGVIVIVGDPSGFPFENDLFIPSGKFGSVGVWGDAVATTNRLQKLSVSKRRCLFPHERRILYRAYLRQNCIANCYRKFVQSRCKCTLDFIYYQIDSNETKFTGCKMKHLRCLAEYNYAFNNHLSEESIRYDESLGETSFCECPDDCKNQKYIAKLRTQNLEEPQKLECDVHFERSFCTLYRTDIAFDYLDAIVAYGSIAGLFLGASLISVAEFGYQAGSKLLKLSYSTAKVTKTKKKSNATVLPLYIKEFTIYNK